MTLPGLGPVPAAGRGFQRFFRRWGSKANIRAVFNSVQPVAVVDRYFGDEEGSYQGLTAFYVGDINNRQQNVAVLFGSTEDNVDVNIHKIGIWCGFAPTGGAPGNPVGRYVNIYTPIGTYDPVLNLAPVGFYESGLILPPSFTRGTCVALAGSNPDLPLAFPTLAQEGFTVGLGRMGSNARNHFTPPTGNLGGGNPDTFPEMIQFDPPLRLPDGVALAVQWAPEGAGFTSSVIAQIWVTFLYTERRLAA